jgi:hypothetical protein
MTLIDFANSHPVVTLLGVIVIAGTVKTVARLIWRRDDPKLDE